MEAPCNHNDRISACRFVHVRVALDARIHAVVGR